MDKNTITVTVCQEGSFWVAIFERVDCNGLQAARQIFGKEPTDPELYEFVLSNYELLRFSEPLDFKLVIKRTNFKRMQREVKKELLKAKTNSTKTSFAQDALRIELEKNKKEKKVLSKAQKEALEEEKFLKKQAKKKEKLKGH